MNDEEIKQKALEFIKKKKRAIINKFTDGIDPISKDKTSFAIFMAGSPGAGKTEFSKNLIQNLSENGQTFGKTLVRIDTDEIRDMIPDDIYTGQNAHLMQYAASTGTNYLFDYISKNNYNFILDGTLSNPEKAKKNIERMLKKEKRQVDIFYIYQEPEIAWNFTKKREAQEKRRTRKEDFIKGFLKSKENVNEMKRLYPHIRLFLVIQNTTNQKVEDLKMNIENVDFYIKKTYNEKTLLDKLK